MNRRLRTFIASAGSLILLAGCDTTEPGTTGQITVQLTDASVDDLQSAVIWVSSVYVIGGGDSTGPRYTILSTPQQFDLLTLTDGATTTLGNAAVPTGRYTQMRFIVDSARVTFKPGVTFSDGSSSRTLQTPSAHRSGIKVNFSGPVDVTAGQTVLVVDFDVSRNFVFTGPSASPNGALFKPVLHATVRDVAATIAGTVTPVTARARVYAILNGDTVTSAAADTLTGTYKLWYLPPGAYAVAAVATGFQTRVVNTTVADAQDRTGIDFALSP